MTSILSQGAVYVRFPLLSWNCIFALYFISMIVKDSNGNQLNDGDSVILIKSLPVKGTSITLKKGTVIKNIKLTDDDAEVDCKVEKMRIVLKTAFLKKG